MLEHHESRLPLYRQTDTLHLHYNSMFLVWRRIKCFHGLTNLHPFSHCTSSLPFLSFCTILGCRLLFHQRIFQSFVSCSSLLSLPPQNSLLSLMLPLHLQELNLSLTILETYESNIKIELALS